MRLKTLRRSAPWIAMLGAALLVAPVLAAADVLDDARALQRQRAYREARDLLDTELDQLRGDRRAEALLIMAELADEHKQARRYLREAANASRNETLRRRADLELARLDFGRGNYNSVRTRLERYDDAEAQILVAQSWVALQQPERAEAASRRAGSSELAEAVRAWAERERGETRAALKRLRRLAERGGDLQPVALLWKAECEAALGDVDAARASARDLQQRYPHSPEVILLEPTLIALRRGGEQAPSRPQAGYVLQIGAFEERANALRFRDTLPRDIRPVRVDESMQGARRIHRVLVGPFETREAAEAYARAQLEPHNLDWRVGRAGEP